MPEQRPRLVVLGAGAWGTALATHVAAHAPSSAGGVMLYARDPGHAAQLHAQRVNARYLPGCELPAGLQVTASLSHALGGAIESPPMWLVATPMGGLRAMLREFGQALDPHRPHGQRPAIAWLCKGFEAKTALLGHEMAAQELPGWPITVISGPSFAAEVAQGQPTALVAASTELAQAQAWAQALHLGALRVYTSDDPIGAEVGGAVKNVLAIATGACDGLPPRGLGTNARAALVTRGLAEMTRLGVRMGARAETFMGLTGLGDLVLTATGPLSRNRQVGLKLAQGLDLTQILAELGHVAEGVASAPMVLARAQSLGVDMPITSAVVAVLAGDCDAGQAVARLLAREPTAE